MKKLLLSLLDSWVPPDLFEFEQREELIKARSLVFVVLVNAALSLVVWVFTFSRGVLPEELLVVTPYTLSLSFVGYTLALWIFRAHGLAVASANLCALVYYASIAVTVLSLRNKYYIFLMLIPLSMPFILALIANFISALIWFAIIVATPFFIISAEDPEFRWYFLRAWGATCTGLAFVLYLQYLYHNAMRQRVSGELSEFEFAAAHDPLTGLANRSTFDRRLAQCIDQCLLHNTKAVLLLIDLDKFKPINDSYGHKTGDVVLTTVAGRLRQLVRRTDTVARLGGDEFAVLFDSCDPDSIAPIIARMGRVISEPMQILEHRLSVECSIGMVTCPDDGVHPEQLVHKADQRMYAAKHQEESEESSAAQHDLG